MNMPLTSFKGPAITEGAGSKKTATLGYLCVEALLDPNQAGDKYARYQLARRINECKESVDMTSEEITMIKGLIVKRFPPMVVGVAFDLIEGNKNE